MEELGRKSVEGFRKAGKTPVRLILENVRSMHNVGSVFRTADAFLLEGMHLCGYTPHPPHRDIHKTALGATETVEWHSHATARDAIAALEAQGYETWAVEQAYDSIPLHEIEYEPGERIAILFGNEVEGVSEEALSLCRGSIEIPQLGMKHSLNVSVAAAIVLWELCRKRFHAC